MLSKQILSVLLLIQLGLLGFTMGAVTLSVTGVATEALVVTFLVISTVLFFGVSIQDMLKLDLTSFLVGFVANVFYSLTALLGAGVAVLTLLGVLSALTLVVNVLAVQNSKRKSSRPPKMQAKKNYIPLEAYSEEETPNTIIEAEPVSATPVTTMLSEVQEMKHEQPAPTSSTNIMNVKIDAPKQNDVDAAKIFMEEMRIRKSIDKVDEKLDKNEEKVEKRIENVKKKIDDSFDDVKKEIDSIKKEKGKLFIASKGGKKIHTPGCMVAERIPDEKRVVLEDYESAVKKGYTSCGVCHPLDAVAKE